MRKVIDLECHVPPDENGNPRSLVVKLRNGQGDPELLDPPPGYGFENYDTIFTKRAAAREATDSGQRKKKGMSLDDFVASMDRGGVEVGVPIRMPNYEMVKLVKAYPGRFIGLATISPFDGMRGVRELENLVRKHGLHGLRVVSLYNQVPASDRRYYPLYAKCVELDVPVRIYTSMNYASDRPYDIGHPRHLDQIGIDFPELRMIAGLSGWPWVGDMVGLLRRHANLYADTASHHPKYFGVAGSGWEPFLQYGNTLLQDKIMVGLSRETFDLPFETLVEEYAKLPLKSAVLDKWLYGNAKRFFRLG